VHARRLTPEPKSIVVLHLGDDESILAWGNGNQPSQYLSLPLGLSEIANRLMSNGHLSELAMEQIIAEVEDIVMPLHAQLPASAKLFSEDVMLANLAYWAGMADKTMPWLLGIDAVELLFNRLAALAQGRPASQDNLPTTGRFSAALLVLREWLHHLHFDEIIVLDIRTPDTKMQVTPEHCRS
jgi:hypothetical protein